MPSTYHGPKGSSSQPLLRDYLAPNQQQGAQQARRLAGQLTEEQQAARGAVGQAEADVARARLTPALGTVGLVGGGVPGINPTTPTPGQAQKVLDAPAVALGEVADAQGLWGQVNRATDRGAMAQSAAGTGALMRQQAQGPYSAGSSMLDAAVTGHGGGQEVRAAGRQAAGLYGYLTGAADRGNATAEGTAKGWLTTPAPTLQPPTAPGRSRVPPQRTPAPIEGLPYEPHKGKKRWGDSGFETGP